MIDDGDVTEPEGEALAVFRWRRRQILDAHPEILRRDAELIAAGDADLHRVVEALRNGCAPTTAVRIFA